jgi:predicted Ser/Thr protein kinase
MDFPRQEGFDKEENSKGYCLRGLRKYLISIFKDLTSRKKTKEKKEIKLSKHIFREYVSLPSIISESLFRIMDNRKQGKLNTQDFVDGMVSLLTGEKEKLMSIVFEIFDLNMDGRVHIDDIKIVLVHLEKDKNISKDLANSPLMKKKHYLIRDFDKLLAIKDPEKVLQLSSIGITEKEYGDLFSESLLISKILNNIYEGIPITHDSANIFNFEKKLLENQETFMSNDTEQSSMFMFNMSPTRSVKSTKNLGNRSYKDMDSTTMINLNLIKNDDLHEVQEDLQNEKEENYDLDGTQANNNFLMGNTGNLVLQTSMGHQSKLLSITNNNFDIQEIAENQEHDDESDNKKPLENLKQIIQAEIENEKYQSSADEEDRQDQQGQQDDINKNISEIYSTNNLQAAEAGIESESDSLMSIDESLNTIRLPCLKTSRKMTNLIHSTPVTACNTIMYDERVSRLDINDISNPSYQSTNQSTNIGFDKKLKRDLTTQINPFNPLKKIEKNFFNEIREERGHRLVQDRAEEEKALRERKKILEEHRNQQMNIKSPQINSIRVKIESKSPKIDSRRLKFDEKICKLDGRSPKIDSRRLKYDDAKSHKLDGKSPKVDSRRLKYEGRSPKVDGRALKLDKRSPKIDSRSPQLFQKSPVSTKFNFKTPKQEPSHLIHKKKGEKSNLFKISEMLNPQDVLVKYSHKKSSKGLVSIHNTVKFGNSTNQVKYEISINTFSNDKNQQQGNITIKNTIFGVQRMSSNNVGSSLFTTNITSTMNQTETGNPHNNISRSQNRTGTILSHMKRKETHHESQDNINSESAKIYEPQQEESKRGNRTPTMFSRLSSASVSKFNLATPSVSPLRSRHSSQKFAAYNIRENPVTISSLHEGCVYKQTSSGDKMKKFWITFINKDIFYFNADKNKLKGLHNVTSCFADFGDKLVLNGKKYYSFTYIFPSTNRTYYCDTKEEAVTWVKVLRQIINYRDVNQYFEFLKELGKGQFGSVYLGVDKNSKENVAIKVMDKTKLTLKELDALRVESEILKKCNHKNIVKFIDQFENPDKIFIILEYLSGKNLFNFLISQEEILSNRMNRLIVYQIAQGLKYLSKLGIVHRDLKPENIMISEKNEVKIVDFGLARIFGKDNLVTEVIGTLAYVAPEVIEGKGYGRDIDMWSFGVVIYYLLTGKLAFEDPEKLYQVIKNGGVKKEMFNKKLFPNVSSFAIDLCKQCLSLKPERITIEDFLKHPWFNTT